MSHATIRYLYCDGEDCPRNTEAYLCAPNVNDSIAHQRQRAKRDGWLVAQPGGKDYCTECRPDEKKEPTP